MINNIASEETGLSLVGKSLEILCELYGKGELREIVASYSAAAEKGKISHHFTTSSESEVVTLKMLKRGKEIYLSHLRGNDEE